MQDRQRLSERAAEAMGDALDTDVRDLVNAAATRRSAASSRAASEPVIGAARPILPEPVAPPIEGAKVGRSVEGAASEAGTLHRLARSARVRAVARLTGARPGDDALAERKDGACSGGPSEKPKEVAKCSASCGGPRVRLRATTRTSATPCGRKCAQAAADAPRTRATQAVRCARGPTRSALFDRRPHRRCVNEPRRARRRGGRQGSGTTTRSPRRWRRWRCAAGCSC